MRDTDVLWVVYKQLVTSTPEQAWMFRTREAARKFLEKKRSRQSKFRYVGPRRVVWGPEA